MCITIGHGKVYSLISPATSRCRITTFHGDPVHLLYTVRALYIGVSTATASFSFRSCQFMTIGTTFRIHLSISTASQKRFWALHPLGGLWVEKLGITCLPGRVPQTPAKDCVLCYLSPGQGSPAFPLMDGGAIIGTS